MVQNKLLPKLSQNLLEILNDEEYHDIIIEVGNNPCVKTFYAHRVILNHRSPYFKKILSTIKKKNDGTLINIRLSNILPEIFQIILRYIYSGKLSLKDYDSSDIIKILKTSKELGLQELIPYLESYLIENKENWMEQNFDLIYQMSYENDSFLKLQNYCKDFIIKNPDKILKSLNTFSISEDLLLTILKDKEDNNNNYNNNNIHINIIIKMNEVQIWDYILEWGIKQNLKLSSKPFSNYSNDDFIILKNILQNFIPFIKFTKFTPKEFLDKVYPYKKVIPENLYENLIIYFLESKNNLNTFTTTNETELIQVGLEKIEETKGTQSKPLMAEVTNQIQPRPKKEIKVNQSKPLMAEETNLIQLRPKKETKANQSKPLMAEETNQVQPKSQKEIKVNQSKPLMAEETNLIRPKSQNKTKANQPKPLMAEETNQIQPDPQMTKEVQSKSQIISSQHAELIVRWIDKVDIVKSSTTYNLVSKFIFTRKQNYIFKLLFRGSRDGFTPKKFHKIFDNQSDTLTIIKVKYSNEILGGYNPVEWKSDFGYGNTKDSFIFSFTNKESINDHVISRVKSEKNAINYGSRYGPSFGYGDLIMHGGPGNYDNFYDGNSNYCKMSSYKKPIRKTNECFSIEDFEIFQVIKQN
ncbi:BTB-domain-containing protein [Rhizophagus irregularis]|uniref:BTB-domain-containing protein n=1 Tax=Rhizophagus irregularis TaxID=588596 RepID=A0A2N1N8R3_9GLOM|nr:BTB-domain-containing protein [Rhizophagus irregularis]